jgi:hypothetical protein
MTLRSVLYKLARLCGDWRAVQRGPDAIARRLVRKALGRGFGRFSRKI